MSSSSAAGFSLEGIDDVQDFPWVNEGEGSPMSSERYTHLYDLMHMGNKAFRDSKLDQIMLRRLGLKVISEHEEQYWEINPFVHLRV